MPFRFRCLKNFPALFLSVQMNEGAHRPRFINESPDSPLALSEVGEGSEGEVYPSNFRKTRQAFWPPKPKLFFSATFTSAWRALFGT